MQALQQHYNENVLPALQKEFGLANMFEAPRLKKVVINTGVSEPADPRARRKVIENVVEQFKVISGQQPQITLAKKSIAGFKLRAGDPLGVMVTLRGDYMWEFVQKLIAIALPRVKDFRGVPKNAFDHQGNYSLGIEEQIIFPEVNYDAIESVRGLQVVFVTSAKNDEQAFRLLELLGMPFEKEN
jgi:large subunit ribosomal protein L5